MTERLTSSKIPNVAIVSDACFAEIQELVNIDPDAEIPDDTLASLHMLFGKNFSKALEVVDGGGIVCYEGEVTGRRVFKVPGRRPADQYIVFPTHYCSCHSFQFDVVGRGEAVCCKHQLAARLATMLNRVALVKVPDFAIAHMLLEQCA